MTVGVSSLAVSARLPRIDVYAWKLASSMGIIGVVRIVAAEQKNAHQRAVVRPALRQRRQQSEGPQGQRSHRGRADRINPLRENIDLFSFY